MKRSTFLATAALSLAALFVPRKAKATTPTDEPIEPETPELFTGCDLGNGDATFTLVCHPSDKDLWEQVAVGHWPNTPRPATLHVTCPHCQGSGFVRTPFIDKETGMTVGVDSDECYYCRNEGTLLWGDNWMGMFTKEGATALAQAITDHEYGKNVGGHPVQYLWFMLEKIRSNHKEITDTEVREHIFRQLSSRFTTEHANAEMQRWYSVCYAT